LSKVGINKLYSKHGEFMSMQRILVIRVYVLLLAAVLVVVVVVVLAAVVAAAVMLVLVVVMVVVVVLVVVVVVSRYSCHFLSYITCSQIGGMGN